MKLNKFIVMKKILFLITVICAQLSLTCCAQNKVTVKGQFDDFTDDSLMVFCQEIGADRSVQPQRIVIPVKNGKFEWSTEVTTLHMAGFAAVPKEGERFGSNGYARVFLIPGEDVTVSGTPLKDIVNSPFNTVVKMLDDQAESLSAEEAGAKAEEYIKANPNNPAAAYAVGQLIKNIDATVALISDEVKNGPVAKMLNINIAQAKHNAEMAEKRKNVADGMMAPDFTLNDINGKPLALSSLRGKYVILDFWGSWCIWCIRGIPMMKQYYDKYKGKLEILGVDCNDTEEKWKGAVEQYKIPWLHVYNPRTSDILSTYAIEGFPTKIVIDPEGKIARTIVGEDPKFYEYLDSLFQ